MNPLSSEVTSLIRSKIGTTEGEFSDTWSMSLIEL